MNSPAANHAVAIDHGVPLLVGNLGIGNGGVGPRAVDEHVDIAEAGERAAKKLLHRFALVGVHFEVNRPAAGLFDGCHTFGATFLRPTRDHNHCTGARESLGQRTAEHTGAADDDRRLSAEPKQLFQKLSRHESLVSPTRRAGLQPMLCTQFAYC